jgi:hypothetical protein
MCMCNVFEHMINLHAVFIAYKPQGGETGKDPCRQCTQSVVAKIKGAVGRRGAHGPVVSPVVTNTVMKK